MSLCHGPKHHGRAVPRTARHRQTVEGKQHPGDGHWGCSQGTCRCESDQNLEKEQLQEAEFEVRSGVSM